MRQEKNNKERPVSYPKPTEMDSQMKNQDEYSTLQPNSEKEKLSGNINEETTGTDRTED